MSKPIQSRQTPWSTVVVVCGKCARRCKRGYGPDGEDTLRGALKAALGEAGLRRTVRVVEGKCFGICPRKATVAFNASAPGELLIVPKGTDTASTLDRLRLATPW